jgi:ArsR family metal-binding transcriptional regulator
VEPPLNTQKSREGPTKTAEIIEVRPSVNMSTRLRSLVRIASRLAVETLACG